MPIRRPFAAEARLTLCIAIGCAFSSACASTLAAYPGPRRDATTVARLHAPDMELEEVDGYRAGMATVDFELTPGSHSALVRIVAKRDHVQFSSTGSLRVCFVAEAGHTYAIIPSVRPAGVGRGTWYPRIADETTNAWVRSQSLSAEQPACPSQATEPVFPIMDAGQLPTPRSEGESPPANHRQRCTVAHLSCRLGDAVLVGQAVGAAAVHAAKLRDPSCSGRNHLRPRTADEGRQL
jgi:hypothetical protein